MSRVRMVTRTVEVTVAEVMCLNVNTAEVSIYTYEISGKYVTEKDIMKHVASVNDPSIKGVHIQSMETKEILYGMPEAEFIKMAEILPPRFNTEV